MDQRSPNPHEMPESAHFAKPHAQTSHIQSSSPPISHRKIIHIDMDCFYAAVEEKRDPSLRGKPLGVGGSPQSRSVLCTANYEARKFKVRSAMPSATAVRLCPQLIIVPPRFDLYKSESINIRKIFADYTDLIEPLSLDEAYLDVTESAKKHGSATRIATEIRRRIAEELELKASAGIATNKFLAKIASDWKKPNGQFVIHPAMVESFMKPLPIEKIFGVGKVTAKHMHKLGLITCQDVQNWDLVQLQRSFGRSRAFDLYNLSRGLDDRSVEVEHERKSLSVEETFDQDVSHWERIRLKIPALFEDWHERMSQRGLFSEIKSIFIKQKFMDFKSMTHERQFSPDVKAQSRNELTGPTIDDFYDLLKSAREKRADPIRLLGIGARFCGKSSPAPSLQEQMQMQFSFEA